MRIRSRACVYFDDCERVQRSRRRILEANDEKKVCVNRPREYTTQNGAIRDSDQKSRALFRTEHESQGHRGRLVHRLEPALLVDGFVRAGRADPGEVVAGRCGLVNEDEECGEMYRDESMEYMLILT